MSRARVHLIAAARPNFMKVAPLYHALKQTDWCAPVLVHTGQHYDSNMSGAFLRELELPEPDIHLGVGSGSHAEQTAGVMVAYERVCLEAPPDWVIVVGDVNSTLACTIVAKKLCLPVAHLEAGLRSFDRTMPEEINRVVTDALADLLWTPSEDADQNLRREGVPEARIERVGNIMIDSYEMLKAKIESARAAASFGLEPGSYGVLTLHRPSNVDDGERLARLVGLLCEGCARLPLVFPVHPRTKARLQASGLEAELARAGVRLTEPLNYIRFMSLVCGARLVITDSGGIQEETTYLGVPCLTLRATTERPITVSRGTNRLIEPEALLPSLDAIEQGAWPKGTRPELWDGHTAERIVAHLEAVVRGAALSREEAARRRARPESAR